MPHVRCRRLPSRDSDQGASMISLADVPLSYNAIDILERNLPERAEKVALYSETRNLTFRQAADEANQVGNALLGCGVRFGEYVAILSLDGPEWVTSFFGIVKIGAIAVGLNTLLRPRDYAYMLRDCRARVLLVHETLLPAIAEIRDSLPFLTEVIVIGAQSPTGYRTYAEWIAGQSTALTAAL